MFELKLKIGVVPIKRSFLSMEEAASQKKEVFARLQDLTPSCAVVDKMKRSGIDALFLLFCDFGEEQVAAEIARQFDLPVLVWGPRDEGPNTDVSRGRDTQCGMFAATKVLRRYGVTYSYICNCETNSEEFATGFDRFVRTAAVVKTMRNLRIAKIGARPEPFMSVATNEAALMRRFGITVVPVSPAALAREALAMIDREDSALQEYFADLTKRVDCSCMQDEHIKRIAALKLAMQQQMEANNCTAAASECWSAFYDLLDKVCLFRVKRISMERSLWPFCAPVI